MLRERKPIEPVAVQNETYSHSVFPFTFFMKRSAGHENPFVLSVNGSGACPHRPAGRPEGKGLLP